jgi:hypothetical protein
MPINKRKVARHLSTTSSTSSGPRTAGFNFTSQSPRGAILVLPDGGSSIELTNLGEICSYTERNAVSWYQHINGTLGRELPNGSLYIITGLDKCAAWGVAAFSNPEKEQLSLRFVESYSMAFSEIPWSEKYCWMEDCVAGTSTHAGPNTVQATPNQCLFLRGYRIALRPPRKIPLLKRGVQVLPITKLTPEDLRVDRGSYIPFGVNSGYFSPKVPIVSSDDQKEQQYILKLSLVS